MAKIGDKVRLPKEKQRYTIQAIDERFAILTKPYNLQKTYTYTIVDRKRGERGACDLIFGTPFKLDTPEGAAEAMIALHGSNQPSEGITMSVSYRNCVDLEPIVADQIWAHPRPRLSTETEAGND